MAFNVLKNTLGMSRDEWLTLRRSGIGGSDAAAIVGQNPFLSAVEVYLDKTGQAPPMEEAEVMRLGNDLEDYVARRFTEKTGKKVRRRNAILRSVEYPFALANVDFMVVGENAGLECKTTNLLNRSGYERNDVPIHYYLQCQHYMMVTGYSKWYLAVYVLQVGLYVFEVARDDGDIAELAEAEQRFWHENVLGGVMPLPDGSEGAGDAISTLYTPGVEGEAITTLDMEPTLAEYLQYKEMADRYEKRAEQCKQTMQARMQTATMAFAGRYRAKWNNVTTTRLDTKALKAVEPNIYTAYARETVSRRFTVEEIKEKKA